MLAVFGGREDTRILRPGGDRKETLEKVKTEIKV
jgi:hypothetical protein